MAHSHGVEVMVDGAHAVGHFQFNMNELDCDYYGSSLHKWLSVPLGAGLLYVKKGKSSKIKPLLAPYELDREGILNLNHTGTHPVATDLAVINAIEFHNKIGSKRNEIYSALLVGSGQRSPQCSSQYTSSNPKVLCYR
jgi:selenocysteine lyase/cysteine desulfurase